MSEARSDHDGMHSDEEGLPSSTSRASCVHVTDANGSRSHESHSNPNNAFHSDKTASTDPARPIHEISSDSHHPSEHDDLNPGTQFQSSREPSPAEASPYRFQSRAPAQSAVRYSRAPSQSAAPLAAALAATNDANDNLMKIFRHKLNQSGQTLSAAFAVEREAFEDELARSRDTCDRLSGQVKLQREKCTKLTSELQQLKTTTVVGVSKMKKFLDGLGNDLANLKQERTALQTEKADVRHAFEEVRETLSIMSDRDESFVAHKLALEQIVHTRTCELKSVVEHRKLLTSQLEDKTGQLSEYRDVTLALRQRIHELEIGERASFGKHVDELKESVLHKLGQVADKDVNFLMAVEEIRSSIQEVATSSKSAGAADSEETKAALSKVLEM
jgi:hypothetical protein